MDELYAERKSEKAAEEALQKVIDEVKQSRDRSKLVTALDDSLRILSKSNETVVRAQNLLDEIQQQNMELQCAIDAFRAAIVQCCSDQNTEALGAAKATALAAGVAEDSAECQIAAKLVAQLIPHLGDLVRDTEAWTDEWYSDKRKVREADLEWMQAALPKLQVAADFRSHAVQVKGASALSPASLTLDNVVTFPTAEQDSVLARAQSMVGELRTVLASIEDGEQSALNHHISEVTSSISTSKESRVNKPLSHALAAAQLHLAQSAGLISHVFEGEATLTELAVQLRACIGEGQQLAAAISSEAENLLRDCCTKVGTCGSCYAEFVF